MQLLVMQLTDVQIEEYKERGFLVLPGFASSVEAIASRMHTLVDAYQPGADATTFDTVDQKQKDDEFFLTSGDCPSHRKNCVAAIVYSGGGGARSSFYEASSVTT